MKAIVVRQPWATLIALGVKTIETRPSPPNGDMRPDGVRGLPGCTLNRGDRLAIVAGAQFGPEMDGPMGMLGDTEGGVWWTVHRHEGVMVKHGLGFGTDADVYDLPLGAVVAVATITDALPIVGDLAARNCIDTRLNAATPQAAVRKDDADGVESIIYGIADQLPLGDFTPCRWGWLLADVIPLAVPVPCKGRQGVFDIGDLLDGGAA